MSDFLTSLIRRERGLPGQDAVAPRLPSAFEDHAEVSEALEEIHTTEGPAVVPTNQRPSPIGRPEVMASGEEQAPERAGPEALHDGARLPPRTGETVTTLRVVESPSADERVETLPGPEGARPTPVTSVLEPRRDASLAPAPETSTHRIEERLTVLTRVDVREADTAPPQARRARWRVEPVGPAIEPRPASDGRFSPRSDTSQPTPTIHVTIGRIDVRAVAAESPVRRPATAPSHPPMGLDEYLERRNRGSQP